jgi:hypothetical protein
VNHIFDVISPYFEGMSFHTFSQPVRTEIENASVLETALRLGGIWRAEAQKL